MGNINKSLITECNIVVRSGKMLFIDLPNKQFYQITKLGKYNIKIINGSMKIYETRDYNRIKIKTKKEALVKVIINEYNIVINCEIIEIKTKDTSREMSDSKLLV